MWISWVDSLGERLVSCLGAEFSVWIHAIDR